MKHAPIETLPAIVHPSRAGLESWLAQQPRNRRYNWNLSCHCFVGTYLREACGIIDPIAMYPNGYDELIGPDYFRIAQREPWTCGAALARMQSLS